jgi:GNAT superfamily N-acetyltransferase
MFSIIRAKVEDAPELLKVKINSFREEAKMYGSGPPGYDSLEELIKGIENGFVFKFVKDEKIIGGMGIYDKGDLHYRIGSIYIDLDYQNHGIGSLAMNFIGKEFAYVRKWTLETPYQSYRNHHFYEKFGFKKIGETEPDQNGFYLFLYERINNTHKG